MPHCGICVTYDTSTAVSLLGQEICDPVYQNIPSLGSAVSSAVAAATSLAAAQLSKDPTKSASFPLCAVSYLSSPFFQIKAACSSIMRSKKLTSNTNQQICQNASLPSSGCGSLSNRACVCTSPTLTDINTCELKTCSASDFQSMMTSISCLHPLERAILAHKVLKLCHVSHVGSRGRPLQPCRRHPKYNKYNV